MEGNYLRLMPGLSLEDRTNWYASSRWRRVIWSVLGGRLWSTRTFQQELKGEMMRSGVDCHWKGQVIGSVGRGPVPIHSSGQTISSLALIQRFVSTVSFINQLLSIEHAFCSR